MAGEVIAAREAAERATAITETAGGFAEVLADGLLGISLLLNGERGTAEPLLRRYEPLFDDSRFLARSYSVMWPAGLLMVWLEEHD